MYEVIRPPLGLALHAVLLIDRRETDVLSSIQVAKHVNLDRKEGTFLFPHAQIPVPSCLRVVCKQLEVARLVVILFCVPSVSYR